MNQSSYLKRVKRRITGREHDFFAICAPGLRKICFEELKNLGFKKDALVLTSGGVLFQAKPEKAMTANLSLGSPSRILMRIANFKATSFSQLEKKLSAIDWILHLPLNAAIDLKVTAKKSRLYHTDAIAQRALGIIQEKLKSNDKTTSQSHHTIFIRAEQDRFTISIDTSGDLLFKRGIKTHVSTAPLRETIAFSMLHWAGLLKEDVLLDPMCGSGTFSLEAAMMQSQIPPGLHRQFAFQTLPGFSTKGFEYQKRQALKNLFSFNRPQIFASDIDPKSLAAIKTNINSLKFEPPIDIAKTDFFSLGPPNGIANQKGVIMLNPPYGKRLGETNSPSVFLNNIHKKLVSDFKGWRLGIILPSKQQFAQLNLKLSLKPVFHGGIEAFAGIGLI